MLTWMRTSLAIALLALAAVPALPGTARADEVHGQVAFLAQLAIQLTADRLTLDDEFLIRLPEPEEAPSDGKLKIDVGGTSGVVDLLGAGLDVSDSEAERRTVVLQFRPNFGRRGGLLRATVRF